MDLENLKKQLKNNNIIKNEALSTLFLKSKFGDMECKYYCYKDYKQIGGDLKEILDEFQMFLKQIKK